MSADHDVADFLVTDGAEEFDAVLEDAAFEHLFEVDGFGAGAGDDEAGVGVCGEDSRDGGDEEVGAFVVEEAGDDDDGDGGVGGERGAWLRGWGEIIGDDGVGDYGDHERVEGGAEDGVFFAGKGGRGVSWGV